MLTENMLRPEYRDTDGGKALVRLLFRLEKHKDGSTLRIQGALCAMHVGLLSPDELEPTFRYLEPSDFEDVMQVHLFAKALYLRDGLELCGAFLDSEFLDKSLFSLVRPTKRRHLR